MLDLLRASTIVGALWVAASLTLTWPSGAQAHEHRQVGAYGLTVGWADEPAYTGFKNGVHLMVRDAAGKPVTDMGDTLKVEVIFGTTKTAMLPVTPAFGKTFGRPGDYRAPIIPTRPGNYTFHFAGTIHNEKIDQSFTSSEQTFDPVSGATEIEFPAKDPSPGELAGRLEREGPRIEAAQAAARAANSAASQSRLVAVIAIVLGAVGIVLTLMPRRRTA
jgi:hypothetical protein